MSFPWAYFYRYFFPRLQDILPNTADKVNKILVDEFIATNDGRLEDI